MQVKFSRYEFSARLKSMLRVDMRRMFKTSFLYILLGCSFVMPILILVMTTMMDGTTSVNPQTGVETTVEGFDSVWQIIGTLSSSGAPSADMGAAGMDMGLTTMCNINMLYFIISVLVCIFVSDEFRCGYAKNLFTVRADKTEYVISKTIVCTLGGAGMILAFFVGSMLGGAICHGMADLSLEMVGFGVWELVMCMLAKLVLVAVFVPIFLLVSVAAKEKAWLSILISLSTGMLLFMMIPMITPLDAGLLHVVLCLAGAVLFGWGLGAISKLVLDKTSVL